MKIKKITRDIAVEHTWDISTDNETYILSNGCISHNTSAQITNSTNGIEPPRGFISIKQSKDGILKQVVPEFRHLKNKYDLLWDQKNPKGYLKIVAVLQKYIDQSISTNTSYNPEHYNDMISLKEMINDVLFVYKMGIKTLYYFQTYDGQGEINIDSFGGDNGDDPEDCDSCHI